MDSEIIKKIKKYLSAKEIEKFDKGLKALVKEATEKNIAKVKQQFTEQTNKIVNEQKEDILSASEELIEESVKEKEKVIVSKERNKQIKLTKQINELKDKNLSLNSSVKELKDTNEMLKTKLSKQTKKTSDETINESVIVKDCSQEVLGVFEESVQTTMKDLQNNLNGEVIGNDFVSQLAKSIERY